MKCDACHKDATDFNGGPWGVVCKACLPRARDQYLDRIASLRMENMLEAPDELDLEDFERFTLKVAVHCLDALSDDSKKSIQKENPMILVPDLLALEFKGRVLKWLGDELVVTHEAKGHEKLFHDGTYRFRYKIPKDKVFAAFIKAGILKESE